jgi:hypothetical protein
MVVKFRTYCGLAGSLDELLIGESEGLQVSRFIPRTGPNWYRIWRMRRAKGSILREFEIVTGAKHYEANKD